jgi:hypothetical protein
MTGIQAPYGSLMGKKERLNQTFCPFEQNIERIHIFGLDPWAGNREKISGGL